MNDKELLMMAAKVAAVVGEYRSAYIEAYNRDVYGIAPRGVGSSAFWNPLTADGDALRLAVKLKMDVCVHHTSGFFDVLAYHEAELICATECCENDSLAATRRAIVRAAAEIGSKL